MGPQAISSSGLTPAQDSALRGRIGEFVGVMFYGTMMKMMRNSVVKGQYGHGGRGEEVFQAQLDFELARRMGQSQDNSLTEAVYRSLMGSPGSDAATAVLRTDDLQAVHNEVHQQARRYPSFTR